jgi:eukaryotic-like serine/threonine-protein kinase
VSIGRAGRGACGGGRPPRCETRERAVRPARPGGAHRLRHRPHPGREPLTVSGEFVGSLESIAPERMQGIPAGPASDLWSLGGGAAVRGGGGLVAVPPYDAESTLAAILQAEPPEPVRAGPLAELIVRLLSKDPSQRPSVGEVERELSPTRPFPNWGSAPDPAPQSPPDEVWGRLRTGPKGVRGLGARPRFREGSGRGRSPPQAPSAAAPASPTRSPAPPPRSP